MAQDTETIVCTNYSCKQKLRVPTSKGRLAVTCPICKESFEYDPTEAMSKPSDSGLESELNDETTEAPQGQTSTAPTSENRTFPSRVFPDFPINALNATPAGSVMKGEYLGNIGAVGLSICDEFQSGKSRMRGNWPDYADGELAALERAFRKMFEKAGGQHNVDVVLVRELARQYVERLISSREAHSEFMNAKYTLWYMFVDFANTLGYGGAINGALDWAKNSAWLG